MMIKAKCSRTLSLPHEVARIFSHGNIECSRLETMRPVGAMLYLYRGGVEYGR